MLSDKKFEKISKILGAEFLEELNSLGAEELKSRIVEAEQAVKTASEELEQNEAYQQRKEDLATFSKALSEVKKRQSAITRYSLHLLEEKGK